MSLNLQAIRQAADRIKTDIERTPLMRSRALEDLLGHSGRIFLKCENFQTTRSFKLRGAFNALYCLSPEERRRGVVARSSGNFAQALAYAAHRLGVQATVIMPENAPETKMKQTAKYGKLVLAGTTHAEGEKKAQEIAKEQGKVLLHAHNHLDVMAGQGTIALEILEELPTLSTFICPIGGGGLLGGCATAFKELHSSCKIIGVEPQGANDCFLSLLAGKRVHLDKTETIADGLRTPMVGALCWEPLRNNVDEVKLVSDQQIITAMKFLYDEMKMVVEPSGAVSVAALMVHQELLSMKETDGEKKDAVCVMSGANLDQEQFLGWVR